MKKLVLLIFIVSMVGCNENTPKSKDGWFDHPNSPANFANPANPLSPLNPTNPGNPSNILWK